MATPEKTDTPEEFLEKLRRALKKDGDFPASARVVAELRRLASDPRTPGDKITELILREPSLGTRILSVVNSAFFRRVKPIMTVSQAVVQLGMKSIAELCAGLILLQKFVSSARQNTPFAACLRKTMLTSLTASALNPVTPASKDSGQDETGYLAGAFLEMGVLLLAFYFPQVYESAFKRAEQKHIPVSQALFELIGVTTTQLSIEVIKALELPQFYIELLQEADNPTKPNPDAPLPILKEQAVRLGRNVKAAETISQVISEGGSKAAVDNVLQKVQADLGISMEALQTAVGALPSLFQDHCSTLQLTLPPLPDFVAQYNPTATKKSANSETEEKYGSYLQEIKNAVEASEPTASVITSVMEALAFGIKFDRVMLLLLNNTRQKLIGRMMLGQVKGFDPSKCEVIVTSDPTNALIKAISMKAPTYDGNGVFEDGWPLTAIPIGISKQTVGIVYADRQEKAGSAELNETEKAAIQQITELLEKSVLATAVRK